MQAAVGFEQIKAVIADHVPPLVYKLEYDTPNLQWKAFVTTEDAQGQGVGQTKAEATKAAYFNWLQTRLDGLNAADSDPSAPETDAEALAALAVNLQQQTAADSQVETVNWESKLKTEVLAEAERRGMEIKSDTTKAEGLIWLEEHPEVSTPAK